MKLLSSPHRVGALNAHDGNDARVAARNPREPIAFVPVKKQSRKDRIMKTTRFTTFSVSALAVVAAIGLTACQSNQPRSVNYGAQPSAPSGYRTVEYGQVEDVQVAGGGGGGTTGGGAVIGGIVGGVAGHQMGGSARGRDAATVGGVVLGAIVGNEIERNQRGNNPQYSVVRVRLENGQVISMEQAPNVDVRPGDRVRVYDRRGIARY
jgi:outer membrane lipoprotein SlyB